VFPSKTLASGPLVPDAKHFVERKTKKHNKPKAMSVLAAKLGRAVYWMLRRKTAFDVTKFFAC